MTNVNFEKQAIYFTFTIFLITFNSCRKEKVEKQDVPETITRVELMFKDVKGNALKTTANDPDGDGAKPIEIDTIKLAASQTYVLTLKLYNGLLKPSDKGYELTPEIVEHGYEHQFFFSWTSGLFANPTGDGNIDHYRDALNYNDKDKNGLPLGLTTTWTTDTAASGKWRIELKHQPGLKSATSTSKDGETDIGVEFPITIK